MDAHPSAGHSHHHLGMLAGTTIWLKSNAHNWVDPCAESIAQIIEPHPDALSGIGEAKCPCCHHNSSRRGTEVLLPACLPPQLTLRQLQPVRRSTMRRQAGKQELLFSCT